MQKSFTNKIGALPAPPILLVKDFGTNKIGGAGGAEVSPNSHLRLKKTVFTKVSLQNGKEASASNASCCSYAQSSGNIPLPWT